MAIINKGTAFSNGEQLSASKLNDLVDGATFGTDSVDNFTTLVNANGAITVRDSGITAAKLTANSVTTAKIADASVTKAKIENVDDYKVLGNVSGAAAAPQEVAILDEDDMVSNSDTALATQQSIKTYVDATAGGFTPSTYAGGESVTLPNGLIMKTGIITSGFPGNGVLGTVSFATAFPNDCVNATYMLNNIATTGETNDTLESVSAANFTYKYGKAIAPTKLFWQAIGY